jgi:hypothetical protein
MRSAIFVLTCSLLIAASINTHAKSQDTIALPVLPSQSKVIFADKTQTVTEGKGWLTNTAMGHRSYHMHGPSTIRFDLSPMELTDGNYRLGLIARTGTHWSQSQNQLKQYQLKLITVDNQAVELGKVQLLNAKQYPLVRESGKENAFANWFGTVVLPNTIHITGKEILEVTNLNSHGGVVAVWADSNVMDVPTTIGLKTDAPHNAFISGQKPTLTITLTQPQAAGDQNAFVKLSRHDLVTHAIDHATLPVKLIAGQTLEIKHEYPATPGLFRVYAQVIDTKDAETIENASTVNQLYAYSPVKWAKDLPDDWPLAAHVDRNIPALPGFKHYRFFAHWSRINTAPGVYEWEHFDEKFNEIKAIGGKLTIAYDGSPLWSSSRGKAGMSWVKNATAYPPDDMTVLEDYIAAMVERYDDAQGTLDRLELCNEPNTKARWQGTPEQYVQTAKAYKNGIKRANASHPIKIIGPAISAGDHRDATRQFIQAGLLDYVDAVSAHWYEEIMSFESNTPINNLIRHVTMLKNPMEQAGKILPMINSECGIHFRPRVDGKILDQQTINAQDQAQPNWNQKDKWLIGNKWRRVSEYRAAATYVAGTVMLMHQNVMPTYYFSHFDFKVDDAPSLPWVAIGQLGYHLDGVDYHHIQQLDAHVIGSEEKDGDPKALAFLLGKTGEKQIIVAWSFLSDTTVGRSKHWQDWLNPVDIQITTDIKQASVSDLYGRKTWQLQNSQGKINLIVGEEPVFITVE